MEAKAFAIKLAQTESEENIIKLLSREGYWDTFSYWRPFDDNENNFSTIGNQQSKADAALVEKIINSVDAMLMKECWLKGIDPASENTPKSISEALEQFYGVKNGLIQNLTTKERNKMSENIILAATGSPRKMNLVIADRGEGQTPNMMPNTILSLNKSNKLKVSFVQGKFNMGGTGVLPFCGDNRFQLIISKKHPKIIDKKDLTSLLWSVTIVRREAPRESRKSSMYSYLTNENNELFSFKSDKLNIIPLPLSSDGKKSYQDMEYGTFIKLFNYNMQSYKSNILFNFSYRLSMLMPNLAHPIRLRECREYRGHTLEATLSGLVTRLHEDRQNNIESGFPDSNSFYIGNQKFEFQVYVFKEVIKDGKRVPTSENYRENDGLIFTINGQTHGSITDSFFNRVNLSYLARSLLVIVDCSNIDVISRENLFMNSRDRLREGKLKHEVVERIKEILKSHQGLKTLQNKRREDAIRDKIGEDKPLENVLQSILKNSPVLSRLLISGLKLRNPFNLSENTAMDKDYIGVNHPTFFKLKGSDEDQLTILRPINHGFRVQFETDVENGYFNREVDPGELLISLNGMQCPQYIRHLGLFNGVATLTLDIPKDAKVNNTYIFKIWINDSCIVPNFESTISLVTTQQEEYKNGGKHNKKNPPGSKTGKDGKQKNPEQLALPKVYEVYKEEWGNYNMKEKSALVIMKTDDNLDYYINMDNIHLMSELKRFRDTSKDTLTKARYKYSMILIGMSIMSYYLTENKSNGEGEDFNIDDQVKEITEILSPIIIPLLDSMTELDIDGIS